MGAKQRCAEFANAVNSSAMINALAHTHLLSLLHVRADLRVLLPHDDQVVEDVLQPHEGIGRRSVVRFRGSGAVGRRLRRRISRFSDGRYDRAQRRLRLGIRHWRPSSE